MMRRMNYHFLKSLVENKSISIIPRRFIIMGSLERHCEYIDSTLQYQKFIRSKENDNFDKNMSKQTIQEKKEVRKTSFTPEQEKRIRLFKLEYDEIQSVHMKTHVKPELEESVLLKLLSLNSSAQRKNMYNYLLKKKSAELADQRKKLLLKELSEEEHRLKELLGLAVNPEKSYGTHMARNLDRQFEKTHLTMSAMYGQQLVFDCQFLDVMPKPGQISTMNQLMFCHGFNKQSRNPFNFVFTGLENRYFQGIMNTCFAGSGYTYTDKSYLDLFPRKKIVYLSPDADECMNVFESDSVYIIAALNDKFSPEKLTLSEVKKMGIRAVRLPLQRFTRWRTGTKTLTVDQTYNILATLKATNSWSDAMEFIPERKVQSKIRQDQRRRK